MLRPRAIKVVPNKNYCLIVTFDNGERRSFDVKPYFNHKAYAELRNQGLFNTVKISGVSIAWIHGQDICPDDLYFNSIPMKEDWYKFIPVYD